MTAWEPATEAEVAMGDALRAQDQQLYFRILTRTDLLLPVSAEALAGQVPMGWGTWTTGGRTHVLAFTSAAAMRACLGENAGTSRRTPYADLAAEWPNHEWWLAVNPGLPIEGYLPAWFVAQLSRGDVRLPGRTMGARARLERAETAARARTSATAPISPAPDAPVSPATGQPIPAPAPASAEATTVPVPNGSAALVPPAPAPTVPPAQDSTAPGRHPDPAVRVPGSGRAAPRAAQGVVDTQPAVEAPPPDQTRSDSAEPGAARSFFEPASGRIPRRVPSTDPAPRVADRPMPPSLLGRGGQPYPRRRPLSEPVRQEPSSAFRFDASAEETTQLLGQPGPAEEPTRVLRVPGVVGGGDATRALDRPGPGDEPTRMVRADGVVGGEEATRALDRPRPGDEPTRMVRADGVVGGEEATQVLDRPRPADEPTRMFRANGEEATQALPRRRPPSVELADVAQPNETIPGPSGRSPAVAPAAGTDEPEELPPPPAEPVSAPPAPRRTLSPIVIEGTVIESRDLTETESGAPGPRTPWAERRSRPARAGMDPAVAAEPFEVPAVPAATSA
ncbi:MAG: SseB family protein, partial [Micromonospora sp.]